MNFKFNYMYRDASNYKQHSEIVFPNPKTIALRIVEAKIKDCLIEEQWFVADNWKLPDLHFVNSEWNEDDHGWHEFSGIDETTEEPTTIMSIEDFLEVITSMYCL